MLYKDLSDKAKEKAYQEWVTEGPYEEWSDFVYEDAMREGSKFGFEVESINFSGFWSQGDGACWDGYIDLEVWVDSEKCQLPTRTKLLLKSGLGSNKVEGAVGVKTGGRYRHSGTMNLTESVEIWEEETEIEDGPLAGMSGEIWYEETEKLIEEIDNELIRSARAYADEIYEQLEKEYYYLTSRETFEQECEEYEYEFDEEGNKQ